MTSDEQHTHSEKIATAHAALSQTRQHLAAILAEVSAMDLKAVTVIPGKRSRRWRWRRSAETHLPETLGPVLDPAATRRVKKARRAAARHLARRMKSFMAEVQERTDQWAAARRQEIDQWCSPIVTALSQIEFQLPDWKRKRK